MNIKPLILNSKSILQTKNIVNDQVLINYEELRKNYKEIASKKRSAQSQYIMPSTRINKLRNVESNLYAASLEFVNDQNKSKLSFGNGRRYVQSPIKKQRNFDNGISYLDDTQLYLSSKNDTNKCQKNLVQSKSIEGPLLSSPKVTFQNFNQTSEESQHSSMLNYANGYKSRILKSNAIMINKKKQQLKKVMYETNRQRTFSMSSNHGDIGDQGNFPKNNKFELKNSIRRKSCYCQNCGGISDFEAKAMHIVTPTNLEIKRLEVKIPEDKEKKDIIQDSPELSSRSDKNKFEMNKSSRSSIMISAKRIEITAPDIVASSFSNFNKINNKFLNSSNVNMISSTKLNFDLFKKSEAENISTEKSNHALLPLNQISILNRKSLIIGSEFSNRFKINKLQNQNNNNNIIHHETEEIKTPKANIKNNLNCIKCLEDNTPITTKSNLLSNVPPLTIINNNENDQDLYKSTDRELINNKLEHPITVNNSVNKQKKSNFRLNYVEKPYSKISLPNLNLQEISLMPFTTATANGTKSDRIITNDAYYFEQNKSNDREISDNPDSIKKQSKMLENYMKSPSRRLISLDFKLIKKWDKNFKIKEIFTEPDKIPDFKQNYFSNINNNGDINEFKEEIKSPRARIISLDYKSPKKYDLNSRFREINTENDYKHQINNNIHFNGIDNINDKSLFKLIQKRQENYKNKKILSIYTNKGNNYQDIILNMNSTTNLNKKKSKNKNIGFESISPTKHHHDIKNINDKHTSFSSTFISPKKIKSEISPKHDKKFYCPTEENE